MKNKYDAPLKIKSVDEKGVFSGYGSVFGIKDSHQDIVSKGAFAESLQHWREKGDLPALLWQHKISEPIGIYTKMEEDENGLYVEGRLLIDDDPLAKRAHALLKAGGLKGLSIGYTLNDDGYRYDKEKSAYILEKISLFEVSLVTFPSNEEARVEDVKHAFLSGSLPSIRQVERHLRDVGFSHQQAKAFLAKGYSALTDREGQLNAEKLSSLTKTVDRYFS